MNVYGINTKSVLASTGGIFYIQVKINGDVVASWNRYVNQTIYQPYYHSADVSLGVTAGDTLTYFIYGGTVSNPAGGITGVNYVNSVQSECLIPHQGREPMPPQTTIDIQAELAAMRELLEILAAPAGTKALQALSPAKDALAGDRAR